MNTATLTETSVTVTLDGQDHTRETETLDQSRIALIRTVREHAQTWPCRLVVSDPIEGRQGLELDEHGGVTEFTPESDDEDQEEQQPVPAVHADDDEDDLLPMVEDEPPAPKTHGSRRAEAAAEPAPAEPETEETAGTPSIQDAPSASDFFASKPAADEAPARQGWRGALNVLGMRIPPTAAELEERTATRDVQRGVTSHKTVTVANLKGGSGKTTVTYLLAAVLGRVRGGTVLAWDNNENRGTLAYRSPFRPNTASTAIDLLREQAFFKGSGQVAELVNFVRPQGSNKFDLLASQDEGSDRPVIDGDGFIQLHSLLQTFYRMIIVDTGNASNASTWQAAARVSDQIVIVCANAEDSAQTAAETIDALIKSGYGATVRNSVALVVDVQPQKDREKKQAAEARLTRITDHFTKHMRSVHVLPWEPSLDDGERIEWEKLSARTHKTMLSAAASIINGM